MKDVSIPIIVTPHPSVNPFTASPAPSISFSSSSRRRAKGRKIGLDTIPSVALSVGLAVMDIPRAYEGNALVNVGEDVAELTADVGIVIGTAIGSLETFPLLMDEFIA